MDFAVASISSKVHGMSEVDSNVLPAHYAIQTITTEIFACLEKKLDFISSEGIEKQLNKSIRRGDDSYFGNLLRALSSVCETCLPSVLKVLIKWYEHQQRVSITEIGEARDRAIKRTLAASYLFCVVLIEILPQLHFHPCGCEDQINFLINNSFKQISYRDPALFGNNYDNSLLVAEIFAEVIGVLSQSHSKQIQKAFFEHLNEYRKDAVTSSIALRSIISLLMGMKYFRVQTNQVSEFEMGVSFLNELGSYFLEVDLKQKDLKHALAGLLVEILLPMTAQIKTETNIPSLISFVDKLYGPTYELVNKKQHKMASYPLLTCLLCISQSKFFLSTWVQFLNLTLANLKNKDSMVSRMALESLYRLIWVYIIRISCEGNTATRSRLESICGSLFPRGSRNLVPRDAPLNFFVKIIHFIAQFKVDFAFKEIIFDLIGCTRASRQLAIYPERMNVGLRALMVIVDGLQQKENPPTVSRSLAPNTSGTIHRTKRNYITKPLSMGIARSIGLEQYYPHCRKAFDAILRTLDGQIGRPMMMTSPQMRGKEYNDIIGADVKAKLDLFRTCIAAIPRLLPDPMSHQDLIDFLTRMCIHIDEELRTTAYQSLQNLVTECPEWREDIIHNFIRFFISSIQDTFPALIESMVRLLLQLLTVWKANILLEQHRKKIEESIQNQTENSGEHCSYASESTVQTNSLRTEKSTPGQQKLVMQAAANIIATSSSSTGNTTSSCSEGSPQLIRSIISSLSFDNINPTFVLHCVEGLCIALLCQIRLSTKKAIIQLLREVKQLMELFKPPNRETAVIDVLDSSTPYVIDKYVVHVSALEKSKWPKDFASVCERISLLESDVNLVNAGNGNEYMQWDAWACALSGYCEKKFLPTQCTTASMFAWPILFLRFSHCNQFVDPSNPQNENRSSLLRSSKSKSSNFTLCGEMLSQENYLSLWQKYLVAVFALCHCNSNSNLLPNSLNQFRSMSPGLTVDSSDVNRSMISSVKVTRTTSTNFVHLMQKAATMIRWEATDVRDSVVLGIGSINPDCFEFLLEEFNSKGILREVNDRKNETNVRRRRRKDLLRLQILRIIEFTLFRDFLKHCAIFERNSGTLPQSMLEFFDSIRFHTENDNDRDMNVLTSLRLHFAKLISLIINGTPIEQREKLLPPETKRSLFFLFLSWCGRTIGTLDKGSRKNIDVGVFVEQHAIRAMCALATLGQTFECPSRICEEDAMFRWLETLLSSTNPIVDEICEQTLCLMLHLNEHHPRLLERVIQMCYTKNELLGVRCFKAISMLFSQREFPCEYISLLCLCQSFASPVELASVRQTAFLLVQLLRHQFLNNTFSPPSLTPIMEMSNNSAAKESLEISFPTNQLTITKCLSSQYPQLTMPVFSEICCRLESARPNRQLSLLMILPEWLRNVHFVDPNCDVVEESNLETEDAVINKETGGDDDQNVPLNIGWGSEESTQLILNNLLYLTGKLANEFSGEMEKIWQCVSTSWPSNLGIIVHYLFVALTLSLDNMLPLAKRICVCLLNSTGDRLISLLMTQLQRVGDPFMAQLCRSEMPPFYRWQPNVSLSKETTDETEGSVELRTTTLCLDNKALSSPGDRGRVPKQLPMPPYGGYYCRLSTLLPPTSQSVAALPRNNLGLFLLCDLLLVEPSTYTVYWLTHHPKLLHMATINLDAHRPIVCAHARQILLNICLYFANSGSCFINQVASAVLKLCHSPNSNGGQIDVNEQPNHHYKMANSTITTTPTKWRHANVNNKTLNGEHLLSSTSMISSKKELLTVLVQLFSNNQQVPLWDHEEVSQMSWKPDSVNQLEYLVRLLVAYLHSSIPDLVLHWTNFAIDFAISSNNLHLAGRSFQTAGALGLNPSPFLHRILSRLTEMVGDGSEESQSYITDLFMCLQNLAQNITLAGHFANPFSLQSSPIFSGHSRSVSYTQQLPSQNFQHNSPSQKMTMKKGSDIRHSLLIGADVLPPVNLSARPLTRSQSATTLKLPEDSGNVLLTEKDTEIISQLLFIALAMTESNLDNEFFLGLTFVDKLLHIAGKERLTIFDKLEELIVQHGWDGFPGILGLCLKGTWYSSSSDWAISVFCNCLPHINGQTVISKHPNDAFALLVVASLPQFVLNFDSPTQLCSNLAQKIILYCQNRIANDALDVSSGDHPICNLITIIEQFRDCSFPRERTQWTKCVINYLIDAFQPNPLQLLLFLSEMLERCSAVFHSVLLDVIYLLFAYANYNDSPPDLINSQVVRVVLNHIHGPNGREASKILKMVTDQWNSISYSCLTAYEALRKPEFELHFERNFVKERSDMREVTNDGGSKNKVRDRLISVLSASGHRARSPKHSSMLFSHSSTDIHQKMRETKPMTTKASTRYQNNAVLPASDPCDAAHPSPWAQQQPSEEAVASGGIGFDRMSSPNSLMSAVMGANNSGTNSGGELASLRTTDSFPRVFKEFDFLEAEHDSVSESTESCFNWLSTMRTARCGVCREDGDGQNGANQDQEEDVPDEDDFYNDEEEDEIDHSGFASNRMCIGNFGSSPHTLTNSRDLMANNYNNNGCRNGAPIGGAGERTRTVMPANVEIKRSQSRLSDSNDVSSDTTPVQSRHSDEGEEEEDEEEEAERESVSSCPLSDNENESVAEETVANLPFQNRKAHKKESSGQIGPDKTVSPVSPTNIMKRSFVRSPSTATSSTHRYNRHWQKRHKKAAPACPSTSSQSHQHFLPHMLSSCMSATNSAVSATSLSQHSHLSGRNKDEEGTSSPVLNFRTVSLSTPDRMSSSTAGGGAILNTLQKRLHAADGHQQKRQEYVARENVADDNDFTATPLECSHHTSGLAEQTWNKLATSLGTDFEGNITCSLILLFTQLLRESVVHLSSIFRDASHFLSTETPLLQVPSKGGVSAQLSHSLNVVLRLADCPFLFVTPFFLRSSNLLTSQKFALFEIREHFDTFAERRSQAIRALNSVKSSLKLLLITNNGSGAASVEEGNRINSALHNQQFDYCSQQTVFLCKALHRLSFQLLLLLEKLLEMIQFILHSSDSQDFDMTPAVTSLQRDLLTHQASFALDDLCSADGSSAALSHPPHQSHSADNTIRSMSSLCAAGRVDGDLRQSRDSLVLHLTNKQFKNAFNKLSFLRSHYCSIPNSQFGCCEQMNVDVLLLHFCRSHLSLRMWALVGSLEMLRCWCTQLKEANVQLGILVRNMMLTGQSTTGEVHHQQQSMTEQNDDEGKGGNEGTKKSNS